MFKLPLVLLAACAVITLIRDDTFAAERNSDVTFHTAPKPLPAGAITSDWPCLLGPAHNEVSAETHLLEKFPGSGPSLVWEMNKGEGYAAPAITGDRLVLCHRVKDQEVIDCLDPTNGNRHWRFTYSTAYEDRYGYCNGPRSSPVIGTDAVCAIGAEGKVHCLDLKTGQVRWKHDLMSEFHVRLGFFGIGSTPLIDGNLLIVNIGSTRGPCVAAFDMTSGKLVWGAGDEWGASYASPVPATLHGKHRVLVFAGGESNPPTGGLLCIDPANGHLDFSFPWRGDRRESVNASSPVVVGNQVFISECYGAGGTLLDIAPDFQCKPTWINPDFATHFMSAIEQNGYLYGVDGHGPNDAFLVCVDLKTGKQQWRKQPEWEDIIDGPAGRETVPSGTYRCWLMPADGRCLCLGEFGHLLWIELSPQGYREVQRSWLFAAGETWTPPVLSKGLLYICQNARDPRHNTGPRLLCYDLRGLSTPAR